VSHGDPGGRDPGLAGPGPVVDSSVVDSSVVDSSVVDSNGPAVSVTVITIRAAGDRLQRLRRVSQVRIQLVPGIVPASQASSVSRVAVTPGGLPASPRRRPAGSRLTARSG
jgi:hypothetical protein